MDILRHDRDNNQVFFLLTGKVRVRARGLNETEITLGIMGPGEMFGDLSVLNGCRPSADIQTIEESRLLVVSRDKILTCLVRIAPTALNLLRLQAERMRRLTSYATSIATMDAEKRVVVQLLALASEYGSRSGESNKIFSEGGIPVMPANNLFTNERVDFRPVTIRLKLTQSDLASLCGCSVKQVYRTIAALREQHLITIEKGSKITLQDPARLRSRYLSGQDKNTVPGLDGAEGSLLLCEPA